MIYDIYSDEDKIMKKRDNLRKQYEQKNPDLRGEKRVSFSMPDLLFSSPLEKLFKCINETKHKENFHKLYYYIATDKQYIQKIIPASEYYKYALSAIADKIYSINTCKRRINELIIRIQQAFKSTNIKYPKTNQTYFRVNDEVYSLKAELGYFFFIVRSTLDSIATITNFLYGPTNRKFSSFNDFYKYILKEKNTKNDFSDPNLKKYFMSNMDWFLLLTDIRDYITHFSSIHISFFEITNQNLTIYLEYQFEMNETIGNIYIGLSKFLEFYINNTVQRLNR